MGLGRGVGFAWLRLRPGLAAGRAVGAGLGGHVDDQGAR